MQKLLTRFSHPLRGIVHAIKHDQSFQTQVIGGILFLFVTWLLLKPLAAWEWLFIGLAWTLILITELQNSALEEALDRMHPELNEKIGRSKDMAAGAVLLAFMYTISAFVALSLVRYFA